MTCENVCVHFLMAGTHLPQGDFHLLKTPNLNMKNKNSAKKKVAGQESLRLNLASYR